MIPWHLALFILAEAYLIYRLLFDKPLTGDYNFDLRPILWIILAIALLVVYGGIFWW